MARAELETARAWGVPRSIFLGRPAPAPGEPLWLDDDRDWAIALHLVEADTCDGCGQPRSESVLPENEFAYSVTPIRCHSCAALRRSSRGWLDGQNETAADGVTFHVHHD